MTPPVTVRHVPIELADRWRWWEPVRLRPGPRWFYGVAVAGGRPAASARPETVDEPLRPLVALLRSAGVPTLPSCAGHFTTPESLRRTYRALQADERWIRGHGLTVRCSETGELRALRVPGWRLPPFAEWAAPVLAANGRGRIGLVLPAAVAPGWARSLTRCAPGVTATVRPLDGSRAVVDLRAETKTPASRDAAWRAVTRCVARIGGRQ